jgi:hypothetical protein
MPREEWLEKLQAGDEVIVHRERHHYVLARVKRITPTGRITVDDGSRYTSQFSREGVLRAVGGKIFHLLQATPQNREKAERHRIAQRIQMTAVMVGASAPEALRLDALRMIDAAIGTGTISISAEGLGSKSLFLVMDDKGDGFDGITLVTATTPGEAAEIARPLMLQGATPRARRVGTPSPDVAATDVILYTTAMGAGALSPDEDASSPEAAHPRLQEVFLGVPVPPEVREHNAYVVGWEDGARDDRTHYLGGCAYEAESYRAGFEDGTQARHKAWEKARRRKEAT